MLNRQILLVACVALAGTAGCSDSDEMLSPLVSSAAEPPGANCAEGGTAISAGLDTDGDGVLASTEVNSVTYVCGVAEGSGAAEVLGSLVATEEEPAGENCEFGGIAINSGIDDNSDGTLSASEVDRTSYVCATSDGSVVPDLLTSLVSTSAEPAGDNCEFGGIAISNGIDDDDDGTLSAEEVDSTSYLCAATDGTTVPDVLASLVTTSAEPAGENCEFGGTAISSGVDDNEDGELDSEEVDNTAFVCTPAGGTAEPQVPVLMAYKDEAPGNNCAFGGVLATSGADDNLNGELDSEEVDSSAYVCFPDSGAASEDEFLASTTYVGRPNEECAGGYLTTVFGYDSDGNGELSTEEIVTTVASCNARPSFSGPSALVVEDCTTAITLDTGIADFDGDIVSLEVEVESSGSELAPTIGDDGIITIPAGEHVGSAKLLVTATDNFGAERTATFSFRFDGEGCVPIQTFFGADPLSCVEVDVDSLAGDDRGAITLIPGGFLYNGDDALIRVNLDLSSPTVVVEEPVDTLIADVDAGRLFSLWSSEFAFTRLQDSNGDLSGCCSTDRSFNQLAELDPSTFEVIGTVNLAGTVYGFSESETYSVETDEGTVDFVPNVSALGLTEDTLVVGTRGYIPLTDRGMLYFRVFDRETGELLNTFITNPDENSDYFSLYWLDQEADIISFYTVDTPAGEVMTYRDDDSYDWVEVNVRTGEFRYSGATFADNCDTESFTLDAGRTTVFYHSEGGCFMDSGSEIVGYCSTLAVENDGRINDRGFGGGER